MGHGPCDFRYGEATSSRLLQIIGLFCKRALLKTPYSAKETYNLGARRRGAPKLPRAIRVGPNEGGGQFWGPKSGSLPDEPRTIFFGPMYTFTNVTQHVNSLANFL